MTKEWNEKTFQKWLDLRSKLKSSKNNKDWQNVISVCKEVIQLADVAQFICIMTPLFYKELANACEKTGDINDSLKYYHLAREEFLRYRNENAVRSPSDWLDDINSINKKIAKLLQKKNMTH
jgi:hypothetical protein